MKRWILGVLMIGWMAGCGPVKPPAAATSATPQQPHVCPAVAPSIATRPAAAGEITVEQLALMLPRHPIVVGFDIDDTLLASTPAFTALQPNFDPQVIRPKNYDNLKPKEKQQFHEFWNALNENYDERSTPKAIGKKLLDLHISRGDTIYIISRRPPTIPPTETVTRRLERDFSITLTNAVISTNLGDKTQAICTKKIEYYYGDSDSDITSAVAAGAVPIRVKREKDSYATDPHNDGLLGEAVLKDSDH